VALLMLYEQGDLQLDDPVSRYIPEIARMKVCVDPTASDLRLVEQERAMSIRDLLTHMSGLPSGIADGNQVERLYAEAQLNRSDRSLQEMVQELAALPLLFQPGTAWCYSISTNVVAHLVELIAGLSFDTFLQERIFAPLEMQDTGFFVPPEKHSRLCAMYKLDEGGSITRITTPDFDNFRQPPKLLSGTGGLVSTAADFLRFAQMLLNGGHLDGTRLLGRKTVELMTRNHLPPSITSFRMRSPHRAYFTRGHGFGLGVRVLTDLAQAGVLGSEGEYGWMGAANTQVWIDPKEEMICLLLPQYTPGYLLPIDRQFKVIAYQALID
jgi:CubicO group peptidase (beta-lactamase class C family)